MVEISIEKFRKDCGTLKEKVRGKYRNCYPIPRGGCLVALELELPIVKKEDITSETLIVDDLVDSGKTIEEFKNNDVAVLYVKPHSPKVKYSVEKINDWIDFWYEEVHKDMENVITRMLEHIGENPNRDGLVKTPSRVVRMWEEVFGGYKMNSKPLFDAVFESDNDEMVIVKDIPFYSHCEHHMVPFFGKVHIGYVPTKKVLGLSKFARLVEVYAKRLQIQEQMTHQIATDIISNLKPRGVIVVIEAEHLCMSMRGVKKVGSRTVTSSIHGVFKKPEPRAEFLELIK